MSDSEVRAAAVLRLRAISKEIMALADEAAEIATSLLPPPTDLTPEVKAEWVPLEVGSILYEADEMQADIEALMILIRLL